MEVEENVSSFKEEALRQMEKSTALVLCGGLATRMDGKAKHLFPISDSIKVLDLSLLPLLATPIKHLIFATGNHREEINAYTQSLRDKGYTIEEYYEPPKGTTKAVVGAIQNLKIQSNLFIQNGDDVIPGLDMVDFYTHHLMTGAKTSRVFTLKSNSGKTIKAEDVILMNTPKANKDRYYASGVIVLNAEVVNRIRDKGTVNEEQVYGYLAKILININDPTDLSKLSRGYHLWEGISTTGTGV